jgi:hypothetical protein
METLAVEQDLAGVRWIPTRVQRANQKGDIRLLPQSTDEWQVKRSLQECGVFPLRLLSEDKTGRCTQSVELVILKRRAIRRMRLSFQEAAQQFSGDLKDVVSAVITPANSPTTALKQMGIARFKNVYIIQRLTVPARLSIASAKLWLFRAIIDAWGDIERELLVIQCDATTPQNEYTFFEKLGFTQVPSTSLMVYLKPFVEPVAARSSMP